MFRFVHIFTKGTAFHAFVGFCFGLFYIWLLTGWDFGETSASVINTLITVTASLLAAGAAIAAAVYDSENKRIASLNAARATLLGALVDFRSFTKGGALASMGCSQKQEKPQEGPEKISVDPASISVFKEVIEFADPVSARWLAAILALHQVFTSRMNNGNCDMTSTNEWLVLDQLVAHCFPYARFAKGSDGIPEEIGNSWGTAPDWLFESSLSSTCQNTVKDCYEEFTSRFTGHQEEFEGGRIQSKKDRTKSGW